jgi:hypothetical protein
MAPRPVTLQTVLERLEVSDDGCWLYRTGMTKWGYSRVRIAGSAVMAHRFVYEHLVGPIPTGLQLDHLCRVRCCVNPDHLEPVTGRVNILRGIGWAALNASKTHCDHGHPFDEANTYVRANGGRQCRRCAADQQLRYSRKVA